MHQTITDLGLSGPQTEAADVSGAPVTAPLPALRFDFEEYRKYVEDEDLSEEQAHELLGAIWLVITSFVDLGFRLDPVQQVLDVSKTQTALAADSPRTLSCKEIFNSQKKKNAARPRRVAGKRDS